jgi:pre-rRNA-processing protein TSR4
LNSSEDFNDNDGSSSSGDPSSASEDEGHGEPHEDVQSIATALKDSKLEDGLLGATNPADQPSSLPSHPPLYLDTVFEYIQPRAKTTSKGFPLKTDSNDTSGEGEKWGVEGYEKMTGIDEVFERFVGRVENEPQQCIR